MNSDRRGMDKNHPEQNLPDKRVKDPLTKNPREQLRDNLYRGLLSGIFCTRPTKYGEEVRDVTYFLGVPGCVTKCDKGEGW